MTTSPIFKFIHHFGIALAVLAVSFTTGSAAVIYQQNFEIVSSGWSIGTTTPGTISFAPGSIGGAAFPTRSLELSHIAGNTTRLTSTMPGASYSIPVTSPTTYTFQFDLRLSSTNTAGYVVFLDSAHNSQLPMYVQILSTGNLVVGYWNGTANVNATLLSGYSINTTYTITFTTTPSTGLFSASVSGGNDLTNMAFRRTSAGTSIIQNFNSMQIYNDGGAASASPYQIFVDNILIQTATVPEPLSVVSIMLGGVFLLASTRFRKTLSYRKA